MMENDLLSIKSNIDALIKSLDNENLEYLYSHISTGKMLRSKLILAICEGRADSKNTHKLCAIVEMIQVASLLHDDVIDEAFTRRNAPSINAKFGNKNAVMLGDTMYSKAFYEASKLDSRISRVIADSVVSLSLGEIDDVFLDGKFNSDLQKYLKMITNKTAALIASSTASAAILCGLDEEVYFNFGLNIGIAFQIVDDVLDITSSASTLGKPAMNDFKSGKTTLPYILLFEKLDAKDKEILKSYFKRELDKEQNSWLNSKISELNVVKESLKMAQDLVSAAIEMVREQNNQKLEEMANLIIKRNF